MERKKASTSTKKVNLQKRLDEQIQENSIVVHSGASTIQEIIKDIEGGIIELNPDYQRNVVWNKEDKISLLKTIFDGLVIPRPLFAINKGIKNCIDGKQRLSTIYEFYKCEIYYIDENKYKWYFNETDKKVSGGYCIMNKKERDIFLNRTINYDFCNNIALDDQRKIFAALQNGKTLTAAERMNAESCYRIVEAKKLMSKYSGTLFAGCDGERHELLSLVGRILSIADSGFNPRNLQSSEIEKFLVSDEHFNKGTRTMFKMICDFMFDNFGGMSTKDKGRFLGRCGIYEKIKRYSKYENINVDKEFAAVDKEFIKISASTLDKSHLEEINKFIIKNMNKYEYDSSSEDE